MKYTLSSLLVVLFLSSVSVRAQVTFNRDERRIITITDERRDADSLLPYLTNTSARTAWRAAIGIGNIGDTTVRAALLNYFLAEQRDSVADAESVRLDRERRVHSAAGQCQRTRGRSVGGPELRHAVAIGRRHHEVTSARGADI